MLARPKNAPICAPRLRELSNIVFEQQVVTEFTNTRGSGGNQARGVSSIQTNDNFKGPHHMAAMFRSHKVGERQQYDSGSRQPYYEASVTTPVAYRPHSHYGRATQEQMTTV